MPLTSASSSSNIKDHSDDLKMHYRSDDRSTLLDKATQAQLRSDTKLGSGNFLHRCIVVSQTQSAIFLYLEDPVTLPDGKTYNCFSLSDLVDVQRTLAIWYRGLGISVGDVIAVRVADGILPFLHYIALTSLGAAPAFINPSMPADVAAVYIERNGLKILVSDETILGCASLTFHVAAHCPDCVVVYTYSMRPASCDSLPEWWPFEPHDNTLVMLSHTSGTTDIPKAVKFAHRQFFMGKRARLAQFAEALDERMLSALPQSHSSAISHLETAVVQGIPTLVLTRATGEGVRAALHSFAPTIVAAFPQTYAWLAESGVASGEFASVRRWFSMGDAAHVAHIRRVLTGSPQASFIDAFGSSELGMALFRSVSTLHNPAPVRCIGRPVDVAIAQVLDPETGEELPEGETGLLAVRAPTITPGYWRRLDMTLEAWRNGYFLTGDVAFQRNGAFYQIDRVSDVMKLVGGAVHTLPLEEELQQIEGVSDVSVVGAPLVGISEPTVCVLVLPEPKHEHAAKAISLRVLSAALRSPCFFGHAGLPRLIVAVAANRAAFPLGSTGKVVKRHLRETFAALLDRATVTASGKPVPSFLATVAWPEDD